MIRDRTSGIHVPFDPCIVTICTRYGGVVATCGRRAAGLDLAPFSYISPQKNHLSTIKYELTIEFLSANG